MNHPGDTKHTHTHTTHVAIAAEATDEALSGHRPVGNDHDGHGGDHDGHGGGDHDGHGAHDGHHVEMFRRRFWWSLVLTVPLVVTSHPVGHMVRVGGMSCTITPRRE